MRLKYAPERYDEHLCLRVPVTLWLCLLFLIRHLLLLGITILPTTGQEITVLRELIRPEYLLADLVALPMMIAGVRRRPQAPRWMQRLWRYGRGLLMASAGLYLLLFAVNLVTTERRLTDVVIEVALLSALPNIAIIAYLIRSTLLKDLFAQWPEREP